MQQHHALNVQLADTLVKLVAPNLPNPNSAYAQKVKKEMEAAVPRGYDAVMTALKPHMSGGYGPSISQAVNTAASDPSVTQLQASLNEAAAGLQSAPAAGAEPAAQVGGTKKQVNPKAQKAHQQTLSQIGQMIGANPKDKMFWKRLQQLGAWTPGDGQKASMVLRKVQLESQRGKIPAEWGAKASAQPQAAQPLAPPPPPPPPTGQATLQPPAPYPGATAPLPPAPPPPPALPPQPMTWEQQSARTNQQLAQKRKELQEAIQRRRLAPPAMPQTARMSVPTNTPSRG